MRLPHKTDQSCVAYSDLEEVVVMESCEDYKKKKSYDGKRITQYALKACRLILIWQLHNIALQV